MSPRGTLQVSPFPPSPSLSVLHAPGPWDHIPPSPARRATSPALAAPAADENVGIPQLTSDTSLAHHQTAMLRAGDRMEMRSVYGCGVERPSGMV